MKGHTHIIKKEQKHIHLANTLFKKKIDKFCHLSIISLETILSKRNRA